MKDEHDLKKFESEDINTFIDIGATDGSVSILARNKFPFARILAFEPCKESFKKLISNNSNLRLNVECYNLALGPGTLLHFKREESSHYHRFLNDQEKSLIENFEYSMQSKTLVKMFEDYKIDKNTNFFIKSDCQGGEQYIFSDKKSVDILKKSVQSVIEIHLPLTCSFIKWNGWLKILMDTHKLFFRVDSKDKCKFIHITKLPSKESRNYQILFIRNDWLNKRIRIV